VLKPGADEAINRIAQFLQGQSSTRLRIEGHTDSRGSDSYNSALSQRRADAVARALEGRGVEASRLQPSNVACSCRWRVTIPPKADSRTGALN
jgi:outer membrane protein OmpA-like peptidoglycan-associated protein